MTLVLFMAFASWGCQNSKKSNKKEVEKGPQSLFQVTVTSITIEESEGGVTKAMPNPKAFAKLQEVQDHIEALEWKAHRKGYEIEIIKHGVGAPDTSLQIEYSASDPGETEFRYFPDRSRGDDYTHIRMKKRLGPKPIIKMIGDAFDLKRLKQPDEASSGKAK